jgi:hypothetical protein
MSAVGKGGNAGSEPPLDANFERRLLAARSWSIEGKSQLYARGVPHSNASLRVILRSAFRKLRHRRAFATVLGFAGRLFAAGRSR